MVSVNINLIRPQTTIFCQGLPQKFDVIDEKIKVKLR